MLNALASGKSQNILQLHPILTSKYIEHMLWLS